MTILLAVVAGAALGFAFERGDFCFHSTWRGVFAQPSQLSLVRAYLLLLLISTPLVQLFLATDVINPYIPPLAWPAAIIGGLIFGVGMVVASTCVSGMFYKLGHGMAGIVVALAAWAVGDMIVYRGPLSSLRTRLNDNQITATGSDGSDQVATVSSLLGPIGVIGVVLIGVGAAWYLKRSHDAESGMAPRGHLLGWAPLGALTAVILSAAWLLADWYGADYSYGTSSVPSQIWGWAIRGEDSSPWIPVALVSLIPGALIAALVTGSFRLRGETASRYAELGSGGLLMGVGAAIAGGCNLGHAMVGVPLLSLGSVLSTVAMIVGVGVAAVVKTRVTTSPTGPTLL